MKRITYSEYLADAGVRQRVESSARRARADALYLHLVTPVVGFCGRISAVRGMRVRLDPRAA